MKKENLIIVLFLITTLGFSQKNINDHHPTKGIDIIIKKESGSQPIINTENNPLIDKINKLESLYLNLKTKEIQQGFLKKCNINDYNFYRIEGHQGVINKKKNDVFTEYLKYVNARKTPGVYIEEIIKFPPIKKANKSFGKRTNVRDAHDRFSIEETNRKGTTYLSALQEITNRDKPKTPIQNSKKTPLIDQINKSEFEYINLKIKEVQLNFAKENRSNLTTKEAVFKAYITLLSIEIKELRIKLNVNNTPIKEQAIRRRKAKKLIILPNPRTKN